MSSSVHPTQAGLAPRLERRVGRWVELIAYFLALGGGAVLLGIVIMTVASIFGRGLGSYSGDLPSLRGLGPVPGDFELVEAGTAVAVFAFLPWCQLRRGHVTVDVFLFWAGPRIRAALSLVGNILMTGATAFIAWRLYYGLLDRIAFRETTMILGMPVWYSYALALAGACLFVLVSAYTVWRSINEVARGEDPASAGETQPASPESAGAT